jgi:hypothetical protein
MKELEVDGDGRTAWVETGITASEGKAANYPQPIGAIASVIHQLRARTCSVHLGGQTESGVTGMQWTHASVALLRSSEAACEQMEGAGIRQNGSISRSPRTPTAAASADSDSIPIRSTVSPGRGSLKVLEQRRLSNTGLAPEHERPAATPRVRQRDASSGARSRARPTTMKQF